LRLGRSAPLLVTALLLAALFAAPVPDRIDGLSIDSLFALRHWVFGLRHAPEASPAVVVAIDEESYRTEPFNGLPVVLWTPQLARVLDAVRGAGAKEIGFDLILPTTVEAFIPGYDRDFLLALKRAAGDGKIVLAKVHHAAQPIAPHPGQSYAVGHVRNVRAVNLEVDGDGVVRRVPLLFDRRGTGAVEPVETSFALELAARAAEFTPVLDSGGVTFGATRIAGSAAGSILLNFDGGAQSVPTYSFADLAACAAKGDTGYFERAFAGKIVLFGSVLDVEDRKLASSRFIGGAERGFAPPRCVLAPAAGEPDPPVMRQSLPGVYVHATAINDLLRNDALVTPPRAIIGLVLLAIGLVAGALSQNRRVARGVGLLALGAIAWGVLCVGLFNAAIVLPLIDGPIVALIGFAVPAAFRLAVTDRERTHIRRAFSYYLAPAVIDRMLSANRLPALGGETRNVTILFSDVEGFSALAEGLSPERLVHLMNVYLGAMTEAIEAQGGFVDKYIGDAIVAVFGAPHDDPDHARNAVQAALACQAVLPRLAPALGLPEGRVLRTRIGLSTGDALVGNIGSPRRFNYTVMGDAVNLAARLEAANKVYGTRILASWETASACGEQPAFREVDRVIVKGRAGATGLYEPMQGDGPPTGALAALLSDYALALIDYRAGRFAQAAERFEQLAGEDPPSAVMAARSRALASDPPPAPWDGVVALETK
jgi:adenylate cyclase/guanylate cyclase